MAFSNFFCLICILRLTASIADFLLIVSLFAASPNPPSSYTYFLILATTFSPKVLLPNTSDITVSVVSAIFCPTNLSLPVLVNLY